MNWADQDLPAVLIGRGVAAIRSQSKNDSILQPFASLFQLLRTPVVTENALRAQATGSAHSQT